MASNVLRAGMRSIAGGLILPSAYIVGRLTVTDPEACKAYAAAASEAIRKAGGVVLARGGAYVALEGEARPRNVVIAFPSLAAAIAYWRSEDYEATCRLRTGPAEIELCAVEGVDQPAGTGPDR